MCLRLFAVLNFLKCSLLSVFVTFSSMTSCVGSQFIACQQRSRKLREKNRTFPSAFQLGHFSALPFQLHLFPVLDPITFLPDAFLSPPFPSLLQHIHYHIAKIQGIDVFKNSDFVLASAAHVLKLERYREDQHGPCARMTCKFVKCSIFFMSVYGRSHCNVVEWLASN